jgi:hypothetical protein
LLQKILAGPWVHRYPQRFLKRYKTSKVRNNLGILLIRMTLRPLKKKRHHIRRFHNQSSHLDYPKRRKNNQEKVKE